jgi:hypothetical protein
MHGADGKPLRELSDKSPLPTRGEMAKMVNSVREAAIRETDLVKRDEALAKYRNSMEAANKKEMVEKHMPATDRQEHMIKTWNEKHADVQIPYKPFVKEDKANGIDQDGTTKFSAGANIFKATNGIPLSKPKTAEATVQAQATEPTAAAPQIPAAPAPAKRRQLTPEMEASMGEKTTAAVAQQTASTAAKTNAVPAITVPQIQSPGSQKTMQAGE